MEEDVSQTGQGIPKQETEEKVEEKTEEKPEVSPPVKREKEKTYNVIDEANKAAARIEKANREAQKLNEQRELLIAQERLGGVAEAGRVSLPEKEADPIEYAKKVWRGEANPLEEDETNQKRF